MEKEKVQSEFLNLVKTKPQVDWILWLFLYFTSAHPDFLFQFLGQSLHLWIFLENIITFLILIPNQSYCLNCLPHFHSPEISYSTISGSICTLKNK